MAAPPGLHMVTTTILWPFILDALSTSLPLSEALVWALVFTSITQGWRMPTPYLLPELLLKAIHSPLRPATSPASAGSGSGPHSPLSGQPLHPFLSWGTPQAAPVWGKQRPGKNRCLQAESRESKSWVPSWNGAGKNRRNTGKHLNASSARKLSVSFFKNWKPQGQCRGSALPSFWWRSIQKP